MSLMKPACELKNQSGQILRYAFVRGQAPLRATVAVAEAFRSAALSAFHAITGNRDSFLLSGHMPTGTPDREHRHAYFLPQPNKMGILEAMLVVSPFDRFSGEEMEALQVVRTIQWNGPNTKLAVELIDSDDHSVVQVASHWKSLTPYVPPRRFWGTHGKHHLTPERQLIAELSSIECGCAQDSVLLRPWDKVRVRIASRANGRLLVQRLTFLVEFCCAHPVCAPVAVGHSCHFGLGQFIPVESP